MSWIPDATSITSFRQSPESFRLRFRKGLKPPKTSANQADAGSAMHVALDLWFRSPTSNLDLAMAGLRAAWGEEPLEGQARPLALMERVLRGYAEKWPREKDLFTVVANESFRTARIKVGKADFEYCGILDRKIGLDDARYVMDTKTTGAYLNATWSRMMRQSDQMIGYTAMERALGERCDGFMIDAVHVSDRRSVATAEYLREGPVLVPEWRVQRWAEDVQWTLDEIRRLEDARGVDSPWPVHHNWSFGKPDSYFEFVEQPPELHPALSQAYEVELWEPAKVAQARQEVKLIAKIGQ